MDFILSKKQKTYEKNNYISAAIILGAISFPAMAIQLLRKKPIQHNRN
jgi:hypothetical protein